MLDLLRGVRVPERERLEAEVLTPVWGALQDPMQFSALSAPHAGRGLDLPPENFTGTSVLLLHVGSSLQTPC